MKKKEKKKKMYKKFGLTILVGFLMASVASAAYVQPPYTLSYGGTQSDLSGTGGTHQFLKQSSSGAAITVGQPAFTDISGTASAAQIPFPTASTIGGIESYVAVTHQWINTISTSGVPSSTQPAFSDISGSVTAAQMLALTQNHIYVGNGSNQPADVAMSGDATIVSSGAITLATVNGNVGSFTNVNITVNAKGLITAASNGTTPNLTVVNGGNAAYAIQATDGLVRSGTTLTAQRTYTLDLCTSNIGERHIIKNLPAQTFNIVLAGNTSDTVDGAASVTVLPGESYDVTCAVSGNWDVN